MGRKRICYAHKTRKGSLKLIESIQNPGQWDFSLDEKFIQTYHDPWQAAEDASRSDFGDEQLDRLLKYESIPSDLDRWQKSLRWL